MLIVQSLLKMGQARSQTQNLPLASRLIYQLSTFSLQIGNPYGFDVNVWIAISNHK